MQVFWSEKEMYCTCY